jgi:hypothetical protein
MGWSIPFVEYCCAMYTEGWQRRKNAGEKQLVDEWSMAMRDVGGVAGLVWAVSVSHEAIDAMGWIPSAGIWRAFGNIGRKLFQSGRHMVERYVCSQ